MNPLRRFRAWWHDGRPQEDGERLVDLYYAGLGIPVRSVRARRRATREMVVIRRKLEAELDQLVERKPSPRG